MSWRTRKQQRLEATFAAADALYDALEHPKPKQPRWDTTEALRAQRLNDNPCPACGGPSDQSNHYIGFSPLLTCARRCFESDPQRYLDAVRGIHEDGAA